MRVLRLTVVHLALALLSGWAVWAQAVYRTPSRYLNIMLAVVTLATTALTFVFWLHAVFAGVGATSAQRGPLARAHQAFGLVVLGFCFYSVFLFANGRFDFSDPVTHKTEVIDIGMEEPTLGVPMPFTWATVRSWRVPGATERLVLRWDERLWGGQAVVVSVRSGYYGVPWVSRIEGDVEAQSRAILAVLPRAAQIRKDLAMYYARIGRFADAATATRSYAADYPDDLDFTVSMAALFTSRDRFADVITALDDAARRRERAEVYMFLGYALAMESSRRRPEGVAYLERARAMQPSNWWPHYALGWAYAGGGQYARAIASFEKAMALRPGLYDVEREVQRLRGLMAGAPAS